MKNIIRVLTALLAVTCVFGRSNKIVEKRDVPLQTTWYTHERPPYVSTHDGFLHADHYSWRCYPTIAQTFKLDQKFLLTMLKVDGPGRGWSMSPLFFTIDGEVHSVTPGSDSAQAYAAFGTDYPGIQILLNVEGLTAAIAAAHEVWITISDVDGNRHSVMLPEKQLQCFREMMEFYPKLDPR